MFSVVRICGFSLYNTLFSAHQRFINEIQLCKEHSEMENTYVCFICGREENPRDDSGPNNFGVIGICGGVSLESYRSAIILSL
jgi:hypothetical protein